jgi:hypothetical protein
MASVRNASTVAHIRSRIAADTSNSAMPHSQKARIIRIVLDRWSWKRQVRTNRSCAARCALESSFSARNAPRAINAAPPMSVTLVPVMSSVCTFPSATTPWSVTPRLSLKSSVCTFPSRRAPMSVIKLPRKLSVCTPPRAATQASEMPMPSSFSVCTLPRCCAPTSVMFLQ